MMHHKNSLSPQALGISSTISLMPGFASCMPLTFHILTEGLPVLLSCKSCAAFEGWADLLSGTLSNGETQAVQESLPSAHSSGRHESTTWCTSSEAGTKSRPTSAAELRRALWRGQLPITHHAPALAWCWEPSPDPPAHDARFGWGNTEPTPGPQLDLKTT